MDTLEYYSEKWHTLTYEFETIDAPPPPPLVEGPNRSVFGEWIKITRQGGIRPFYSWYVPSDERNSALVVFFPGADGRINRLPPCNCDCIFVSPLGYGTPWGILSERENLWLNTVILNKENLIDYILDGLCVIKWALETNPDRTVILSGSSQGGGIALDIGAILGNLVAAVCADEPMFIAFSSERMHLVLASLATNPYMVFSQSQARNNLALIDPLCLAQRMTFPVLLVSGELDPYSPIESNQLLYDILPDMEHSRSVYMPGRKHGYDLSFFQEMERFLTDCAKLSVHFQYIDTQI